MSLENLHLGHDYDEFVVRPVAPGAVTQWTPFDGTSPNWSIVNAEEPDAARYVLTNGPSPKKDLYAVSWPHPGRVVRRVVLRFAAMTLGTPGLNSMQSKVVINGNELTSPSDSLTNEIQTFEDEFSGMFVISQRDWLQIGFSLRTGELGLPEQRVYLVSAKVAVDRVPQVGRRRR